MQVNCRWYVRVIQYLPDQFVSENRIMDENQTKLHWDIVPKNFDAALEIARFIERAYEGLYLQEGDDVLNAIAMKHLDPSATTFAVRFCDVLVGTIAMFEGPREDFSEVRYHLHTPELDGLASKGLMAKVGEFGTLEPTKARDLEKSHGCEFPSNKIPLLLMNLILYTALERGTRYLCINVREDHRDTYEKGYGFRRIGEPHTTTMTGASIESTEVFMVLDLDEVRAKLEGGGKISYLMRNCVKKPPPQG